MRMLTELNLVSMVGKGDITKINSKSLMSMTYKNS